MARSETRRTVELPTDFYEQLRRDAKEKGMTISALVMRRIVNSNSRISTTQQRFDATTHDMSLIQKDLAQIREYLGRFVPPTQPDPHVPPRH